MLMPRPQFTLTSPLGEDLRFHAMERSAELSKLGSTLLTLLSPRADLAPEDLLGQALTVTGRLREGQRFFHGYVTRFGLVGQEGRHFKYEARLCPWPWFLTRTSGCRIFQDQSVPDIVKTEFQDHAVADLEFQHPLDTLLNAYWAPTIRAAIALAHVEASRKAQSFELADPPTPTGQPGFAIYIRANAYLALHQPQSAASEFAKILNRPGLIGNNPLASLSVLGMARASAAQDARRYYRAFLALWKDADAGQPVLAAARAESELRR